MLNFSFFIFVAFVVAININDIPPTMKNNTTDDYSTYYNNGNDNNQEHCCHFQKYKKQRVMIISTVKPNFSTHQKGKNFVVKMALFPTKIEIIDKQRINRQF